MSNHIADTVSTILSAVRDQFGISFSETHTGGGCYALEARLESGHWIVATDEGLCGFRERIESESSTDDDDDGYQPRYSRDNRACGWSIGIYPNGTDHGDDWWGGEESIVDVVDYDAVAADLPTVVGRALAELVTVSR